MKRATLGEQFFEILTQVHDYLSFYEQCGLEGISHGSNIPEKQATTFTLETIAEQLQDCQRCPLHQQRTHIIFGEGNPRATLVFIGASPDAEEDQQGQAFVGPAGDLLTKILQAIGLGREDVYLTNLVKCHPPQNRNPESVEIATCQPFLNAQLKFLRPRIICTLGSLATQALLNTEVPFAELRGHFYDYHGIKVMPTYHPSDLLAHPEQKRSAWEDMQRIQQEYVGLTRADQIPRRHTTTGEAERPE